MAQTRYQLNTRPIASTDGSNMIYHDITATRCVDGNTWTPVPNHHKTICLPSDELQPVLNMPHSTGPERQAKNRAYKDLIIKHRNAQPIPFVWPPASDWSKAGLAQYDEDYANAKMVFDAINAAVSYTADYADGYLIEELNLEYPIGFSL